MRQCHPTAGHSIHLCRVCQRIIVLPRLAMPRCIPIQFCLLDMVGCSGPNIFHNVAGESHD